MKHLVVTLTPDATYAALKATAIDMDDPSTGGFDTGFDFGTGFGLIQADAARRSPICASAQAASTRRSSRGCRACQGT
jgi:hypothetical protein